MILPSEQKLQNLLSRLKINKRLEQEDYKHIYPKWSRPVLFYGTAKVHKLKENNTVEHLPLRPIISIGTATYKTAKYIATHLSSLTSSKYNMKNGYKFATCFQNTKIPGGYKMISFEVKSLFKSVPLDKTIKIILGKCTKKEW